LTTPAAIARALTLASDRDLTLDLKSVVKVAGILASERHSESLDEADIGVGRVGDAECPGIRDASADRVYVRALVEQ
jgi:hypothetical protein